MVDNSEEEIFLGGLMGFDVEEKMLGKEVWSFSKYKTKASPEVSL